MRLTDLSIRNLPFTVTGQRDYPDDLVRGLTVRVGMSRKTFMLLTKNGPRRSCVKLGTYPACSLSRARDLARERLLSPPSDLPRVTFIEALETYYRIRGQEQRDSTRARCRYLLDRFFREPLGNRALDTIKTAHLAPLLDNIASSSVRRNAYVYLQAFFSWCYRRGYIDISPAARLERPPEIRSRDRVLSLEELAKIWRACPPTEYGQIIKLCILSAQRIGQWIHYRPEYRKGDFIEFPEHIMKEARKHSLPVTPEIADLLPATPFSWKMDGR